MKGRILIVDDERAICLAIQRLLGDKTQPPMKTAEEGEEERVDAADHQQAQA